MKLEPLEQFICDTCGRVANKSELVLEYQEVYLNENIFSQVPVKRDFKIIHGNEECMSEKGHYIPLFTGNLGLRRLIALLEEGNFYHIQELIEIFKRSQIPYYEMARLNMETNYIHKIDIEKYDYRWLKRFID